MGNAESIDYVKSALDPFGVSAVWQSSLMPDVEVPEPRAQQAKVLAYLAREHVGTVDGVAVATGLSVAEVRAALKALVRQGYAFERLGDESFDGDRPVPRGRYVITSDGRRRATGTRWQPRTFEIDDEL